MQTTDAEMNDRSTIKAAGHALNRMTLEEAMSEIRSKPVVDLWPTAALVLDLSRSSVYEAAKRGEIEVLEYGRLKKAVTAPLRRKLGLEAA